MSRDVSVQEQVGAWIAARRDALKYSVSEFAQMVGTSTTTVSNAETGKYQIKRDRYRWEEVLQWEPGSLTEAYLLGRRPRELSGEATEDDESTDDRARLREILIEIARLAEKYPELDGNEEGRDAR